MHKEAGEGPKKVSLTRKSKSLHTDIQNKKLHCSAEESLILCGSVVGKLSQRTIQLSKKWAHKKLLRAWHGSLDTAPHSP